jgi:hypothetical protein
MNKILDSIKKINIEALIWIAGLIVLAIIKPENHSHFTLCPFKNLGFKYCPGCGLGLSISYLFHGCIKESIQSHVLGIPAVIMLLVRTISIMKRTRIIHPDITTMKG